MAFKFVILCCALAAANAGYLGAPAALSYGAPAYGSNYAYGGAVGASHQSTLRSLDGNHVVSQYSKNVDTPFSSVRKTDTRVSNDAVAYAPAVAHYAAPAVAYHGAAYAAPVAAYHGAAYAAPIASAYHGAAYAAPIASAYHGAAYAAPIASAYHGAAYAAPVAAYHGAAYAAPVASSYHGAAYGAAYGSGSTVSHISFDGIGAHYAY